NWNDGKKPWRVVDLGARYSIHQSLEANIEMKYLFLTYLDEKAWASLSEAEQQTAMAECRPHVEHLIATGKFLVGAPLQPTSTATTVRLRGGKRMITDGPFAETREQV